MSFDRRHTPLALRLPQPGAVPARPRRALSMIELLMAMTVTAMVAAAIAAMWSAISVGESTRRDNRAFTVRTYAAKARISGYVAPSRCVLFASQTMLVLWRDDSRESGTVHASEVRWLVFNAAVGDLDCYFVAFPAGYSDVDKALADTPCTTSTNWSTLLSTKLAAAQAFKVTLVDHLESVSFGLDTLAAVNARAVTCQLGFETETKEAVTQSLTATILAHVAPTG